MRSSSSASVKSGGRASFKSSNVRYPLFFGELNQLESDLRIGGEGRKQITVVYRQLVVMFPELPLLNAGRAFFFPGADLCPRRITGGTCAITFPWSTARSFRCIGGFALWSSISVDVLGGEAWLPSCEQLSAGRRISVFSQDDLAIKRRRDSRCTPAIYTTNQCSR